MADIALTASPSRGTTKEEKKVIFASSLGTVFEWYDFYLYGSLGLYIGFAFFNASFNEKMAAILNASSLESTSW